MYMSLYGYMLQFYTHFKGFDVSSGCWNFSSIA